MVETALLLLRQVLASMNEFVLYQRNGVADPIFPAHAGAYHIGSVPPTHGVLITAEV